ncbi:restriction endonuclease subunit S [Segatella sp.]|jgi:hypothetical protein|uniref:restriction endonuclease subunit S n=1 Tax=Segatella sp. TaxID=2974253 RepID=UPI003079D1F5
MDTKALRQKILDLAIHGKLVPQDPNDEPASVLLERIRAEKERLIKEGKIKKGNKSAKTSDKPHYPFELPKGWVWCKLDDLAFYKKGPFGSSLTKAMFVPKSSQSYKVYEQKNAIHKDCTLGSYYITKEKYDSLIGFAVQPYDIIVSCAGTIGETYVLPAGMQEGIINQALMLIRLFSKEIERFYLLYFDFILKDEAYRNSKGTAIKNIPPFDVLKNFFIPIPPIGEQKRILDEVDRLMSFVSTIETGTKNLHTAIKQAKFKILELAIHGKLVSQDPNDEPASELLKRINPKAEIITDNGHYQKLPVGWTICRLKDISKIVTGSTPSKSNCGYYGGIFPFFKPADLDAGRHVYKAAEYLSEDGKRASRVVPKGTTAICCIGTIGKVGYLMYEGATNQQINCAIPSKVVDSVFLFYLCASPLFNDKLNSESSAVTISIVNKSKIEAISVPLPPLAEQKRIVSKIEDIFAQLEAIETAL